MKLPIPDELVQRYVKMLARSHRLARMVNEFAQSDPVNSILAQETFVLADMFQPLMKAVDDSRMRLGTFFDVIEALYDIQERLLAERREQLARHARQ